MKKALAFALALSMVTTSLVACGSSSSSDQTTTTPSTTETTDTSTSTDTSVTETPGADISEHVTLKMYFHGSNVSDDTAVMAEVNAYLGEQLNVTLEPIWGTWGDFDTNAVLALQTGDAVDIYFTCSWSANEYNRFARDGYWLRLDSDDNNLIEQYGQDIWNTLPNVLTTGALANGADGVGVYAVPGLKDYAIQNCWDVNVTLLEKYGYTVEDIANTDYYGFGEILETVKAGEGADFYPLLVEGAVLERMVNDSIIVAGDNGSVNLLSYYLNSDNVSADSAYGNTLVNKFATDEYKTFVEQTYEYAQAGYIDPAMGNANQANETRTNTQLAGNYLIGTQSYALGYEVQASADRGIEVAFVPTTSPYVDTTASQGAMMAISTASKNPERAMMFLNLLNTDEYLMTLLNYGVEEVHYAYNDNGLIEFTDERGNYSPWRNGMGNITILPVMEGEGDANYWEDTFLAYYNTAKEIPILGYTFDPSDVEIQSAALANVAAQYALPLSTGQVDPATQLEAFNNALTSAGMEEYLSAAQAQLDEFLANK
ncbi:MAG: ABC transporter substrate-binding protein [Eubacteriales bacterium]